MKKLITFFIIAIAMIFITSCAPLTFSASGTYDSNDSFYIEASPYYHRQHYYVDRYYDRHSFYYQKQHVIRNAPMRNNGRTNNNKHNSRRR